MFRILIALLPVLLWLSDKCSVGFFSDVPTILILSRFTKQESKPTSWIRRRIVSLVPQRKKEPKISFFPQKRKSTNIQKNKKCVPQWLGRDVNLTESYFTKRKWRDTFWVCKVKWWPSWLTSDHTISTNRTTVIIILIIIIIDEIFIPAVMRIICRDTCLIAIGRSKRELQVLIAVWHQTEVSTLWIVATNISG